MLRCGPAVSLGVRRIVFRGSIVIGLTPLLASMPIVGGLTIFFREMPEMDYDFTGVGNLADLPVLKSVIRNVVKDIIRNLLVLPTRMFIPIADPFIFPIDVVGLSHPRPLGVVRIQVKG